jgi:hypothetical protein
MLHLYVGLYAYTYKVRVQPVTLHKVKVKLYILCNKVKVLLDKVSSKMQPKVVLLLPFIATFESKVYRYPRKNTQEGRA